MRVQLRNQGSRSVTAIRLATSPPHNDFLKGVHGHAGVYPRIDANTAIRSLLTSGFVHDLHL